MMVALSVVLLGACDLGTAGTSHAERIDVPLSVKMSLGATLAEDCHKRCIISYHAVITNEGSPTAFARDCVARGLDANGIVVIQTPVGLGFPAGAEVTPDQPYESDGTMLTDVSWEARARIVSLDASCSAYRWMGEPPI